MRRIMNVGEVKKFLDDVPDNFICGVAQYERNNEGTKRTCSSLQNITARIDGGVFFIGDEEDVLSSSIDCSLDEYKDKVNELLDEYYILSAKCESIVAIEIINKLKNDLQEL